MLSNIWSFVKRHRKKFVCAGILLGGAVVFGRYAKRKFLEYQERETAEYLAQFRRQHHFESNQRNCNTTVLSLLPRLREVLCRLLNSEDLTAQLKSRPENKLEIWNRLQILSFTRTISAVYGSTMLAVFLRVQLNVLGGYMYQDTQNGYCGMETVQTTPQVQKNYLAGVQYLFEQGLSQLIEIVESSVQEVVGPKSLKDVVSSENVYEIISEVRRRVEVHQTNGNISPSNSLYRFMLSDKHSTIDAINSSTTEEVITRRLVMETYDVIHSQDFDLVTTKCLDDGFFWLTNRIAEYFKPNPATVTTNGMTMPLAKLIPIVNGMVYTILADGPNVFVQELLLKDTVKDFAANVYDAFCSPQPIAGCGIN